MAPVRDHLGELLRQMFMPAATDLPAALSVLVQDLTVALAQRDTSVEGAFREGLVAALPKLKAFAIALTRNSQRADDLVQDTMVRALRNINKFEPGSNLDGWLFTILRNTLLSDYRKLNREVEDPEGVYAGKVGRPPEQMDRLTHQDLLIALQKLKPSYREALLLVGAEGMTYEAAADLCGVPLGTIKSRVNRGRIQLADLLSEDGSFGSDGVTSAALAGATPGT